MGAGGEKGEPGMDERTSENVRSLAKEVRQLLSEVKQLDKENKRLQRVVR